MSDFSLGDRVTFTHPLWRQMVPSDRQIGKFRKVWKVHPYMKDIAMPREGVIVGSRTLANGHLRLEEWGNVLDTDEHFTAYLIAYDLRRKPVYVRPEHIQHELTNAGETK